MRAAIAALLLGTSSIAAFAADLPSHKAPALPPIVADTPSPWLFRLRAIGIVTDSHISVDTTTLSGKASNSVVPELDISYFFTKNIAAEVILSAAPHNLKLTQPAALNGFGLASTVLLPPTLTLQYHFTDLFGPFTPYVGAGLNYTSFLGQHAQGLNAISIRSNVAPAFQVGADYFIDRHWGLNVDVKKLLLRTTYTGGAIALGAPYITGSARLDPWIIGAGVSYRF